MAHNLTPVSVFEKDLNTIENNVINIRESLPKGVLLVAASKTRQPDEVNTAIMAGIDAVGYNYVQEALTKRPDIIETKPWHLIGHLQSNKVKQAVRLFDMIETVDSVKIAQLINKECSKINKKMPVLIEVNSGQESNKTGVLPHDAIDLIHQINYYPNIKIQGIMTMGPRFGEPEDSRPYFKITKWIFDQIKEENIPNIEMRYLSMGMSNSYKIAVEEGANLVRVGTLIFGNNCSK